jgi:hypothetical protein
MFHPMLDFAKERSTFGNPHDAATTTISTTTTTSTNSVCFSVNPSMDRVTPGSDFLTLALPRQTKKNIEQRQKK